MGKPIEDHDENSAGLGGASTFENTPGEPGSQHSLQTSPQAVENTGGPKSVVGQDFILRPIFNRPTHRRLPQRFLAPETFPPGIDSRSWRRIRILAARGSDKSVAAARKSACATSLPLYFGRFALRFAESADTACRGACATGMLGHHRQYGERFVVPEKFPKGSSSARAGRTGKLKRAPLY